MAADSFRVGAAIVLRITTSRKGVAPQVGLEPIRLRASRYGETSPKLAEDEELIHRRAKAGNPPVNRRLETTIGSDQTLSVLGPIDLK
jgi:hypothetical protein